MTNETKIEIACFIIGALIAVPLVFGLMAILVLTLGGSNG